MNSFKITKGHNLKLSGGPSENRDHRGRRAGHQQASRWCGQDQDGTERHLRVGYAEVAAGASRLSGAPRAVDPRSDRDGVGEQFRSFQPRRPRIGAAP